MSTASTSTSRAGEILALVGESGCGKTTLARTLLGLELPSAAGRGVRRRASRLLDHGVLRAYRRRVQLILQDPTGSLNPRQSVYESVAEGIRIHKLVDRTRRSGDKVTEADLVVDRRCRRPACGHLSGSS